MKKKLGKGWIRMDVQKAEQFILNEARPIERAEFQYYFQNGSQEAVIEALRPFQNPDGGFGHALEPDNWNPGSTPIATNTALEILFHTDALEAAADMAQGMVRYLLSSVGAETGRWPFAVSSNKDYPHAVWWEEGEGGLPGWNPTVSLAAFLVYMGQDEYRGAISQAFRDLGQERASDALKCYILAYRLLKKKGITGVIDFDLARQAILESVQEAVCKDVSKYGVEYVPSPSNFPREFLSESLAPQVQAELSALGKLQMDDGGFDIFWQWHTPYAEEFQQARTWWRPRVTMEKLLFYRAWA